MSWSLTRPNISFKVRPIKEWDARRRDPLTPVAGLTAAARKAFRAKRARECRKVSVAIELR